MSHSNEATLEVDGASLHGALSRGKTFGHNGMTITIKVRPIAQLRGRWAESDACTLSPGLLVACGHRSIVQAVCPPTTLRPLHPCIPQDLTYAVKSNTKRGEMAALLQGVTGFFEPRCMSALVRVHGSDLVADGDAG
jgi:hypothetical protein